MLYKFVVFLHIISALGFLLAHGVSASISYALKRERDMAKIRTMLELSASSYPTMLWTLLATVVFGLIAAFLVNTWWRFGWLWVSIALLIVIVVLMAVFGSGVFSEVRKVAGLPYMVKGKPFPAEPAKSDDEIFAALAKINPTLLMIVGYGGFAVIAWLMTAKPF